MNRLKKGDAFFIRRGECPECQSKLEEKEYSIEDDYGRTTVVEIKYCNSCCETKAMQISYYGSTSDE